MNKPTTQIDWTDPVARYQLSQDVGLDEYNRLMAAHIEQSIVATVNGWRIREVATQQWGTMFHIVDTGLAFKTQQQAEEHAATLEARQI
jgi:hypothetical protein